MGILWIFMLVAGLWALIAGRVPMVLFGGSGTYQVDGMPARIIGASLALGAFLSLGISLVYHLFCGLFPVLLFLGGSAIAVRQLRTPYQSYGDPTNAQCLEVSPATVEVSRKIRNSVLLIAIGFAVVFFSFPLGGVLVFVFAFIQAVRAAMSMEAAHVEHLYKTDVNFLCVLSAVLAVFSFALPYLV